MANPEDREYRAQATPLLATVVGEAPVANLRALARLLVGKPLESDRVTLADSLAREAGGADAVVLVALAHRQAGREAWEAFRAQSRDLVGSQPLPGDVVVLVNRM